MDTEPEYPESYRSVPVAPIRIVNLDCWHANNLIYQAEGSTDDGKHVFVRYRRPWFSVGIYESPEANEHISEFATDAHPDHDPGTINRATLQAWTEGRFIWPDKIDGYANEPEDPQASRG